jgi:ElaB/YqjD/DUF883 family membrane-anchored ribosome-binding protein
MADISTTNPIGQTGRTAEQIGEKVKDAGSHLRERSGEMMEGARQTAQDLGRRAQEGFEKVRERASDYMDQGRQQLHAMGETVQDQVQERPMSAILVACGIGFLLGVLWTRR